MRSGNHKIDWEFYWNYMKNNLYFSCYVVMWIVPCSSSSRILSTHSQSSRFSFWSPKYQCVMSSSWISSMWIHYEMNTKISFTVLSEVRNHQPLERRRGRKLTIRTELENERWNPLKEVWPLEGAQSRYFKLFRPRTKLALN